jgi:hypothetical protein
LWVSSELSRCRPGRLIFKYSGVVVDSRPCTSDSYLSSRSEVHKANISKTEISHPICLLTGRKVLSTRSTRCSIISAFSRATASSEGRCCGRDLLCIALSTLSTRCSALASRDVIGSKRRLTTVLSTRNHLDLDPSCRPSA